MSRYLRAWARYLSRCPECHGRWCPVWGAFGDTGVSLAVYLLHGKRL